MERIPVHPELPPVRIEKIVAGYGASILIRRWAATIIDWLIIAGLIGTMIYYNRLIITLVISGFILVYHLLIEGFTGYTVGKLILRIQTVREDGQPPGFAKSLLRTVIRIVDTNPLLFGALPAGICVLATQKKQRLGDMAAGTYVVKVSDLDFKTMGRRGMAISVILSALIVLIAAVPNVIAWKITGYPAAELKSVVHISQDGKFQITDHHRFSTDKATMKETDANIAVRQLLFGKYLTIFTYSKDEIDGNISLEDFHLSLKDLLLNSSTTIIEENKLHINGYPALELAYWGTQNGEEYAYIITTTETSDHLHQFYALMSKKDYEKYGPEFREIIATFKEIDGEK